MERSRDARRLALPGNPVFPIARNSREGCQRFCHRFGVQFLSDHWFGGHPWRFSRALLRRKPRRRISWRKHLAFIWPIVFYLNIRTGALFLKPAIVVDELEDVTERTMNALLWGKTFAIGAIVNSLVAIVVSYLVFLLVFERVRTPALNWLRKLARHRKALSNRRQFRAAAEGFPVRAQRREQWVPQYGGLNRKRTGLMSRATVCPGL
jgi:hypothetical protein